MKYRFYQFLNPSFYARAAAHNPRHWVLQDMTDRFNTSGHYYRVCTVYTVSYGMSSFVLTKVLGYINGNRTNMNLVEEG